METSGSRFFFHGIRSREIYGFRGALALEHCGNQTPPMAISFCKSAKNCHVFVVSDEDGYLSFFNSSRKFSSCSSRQDNAEKARISDWVAHMNAIFDICWIKWNFLPEDNNILTASRDQTCVGAKRLLKHTEENVLKQRELEKKQGVEKTSKSRRSAQPKPKASAEAKANKEDPKNTVARGKKRKSDLANEKDNSSMEKLVKIQVPSTLKKQLVDDWEFVNQQDKSAVAWLCFSGYSEQIITASKDGSLRIWNAWKMAI